MTVFDVYVNDQKLCRAGVGREGVLSAIIHWVNVTGPAAFSMHGPWQPGEQVRLQVGGLSHNTHVSWIERQLEQGDRVSLVVANGRAADPPVTEDAERLVAHRAADADLPLSGLE